MPMGYGKYRLTEQERARVNCTVQEFVIMSVISQIVSTKKLFKKNCKLESMGLLDTQI